MSVASTTRDVVVRLVVVVSDGFEGVVVVVVGVCAHVIHVHSYGVVVVVVYVYVFICGDCAAAVGILMMPWKLVLRLWVELVLYVMLVMLPLVLLP